MTDDPGRRHRDHGAVPAVAAVAVIVAGWCRPGWSPPRARRRPAGAGRPGRCGGRPARQRLQGGPAQGGRRAAGQGVTVVCRSERDLTSADPQAAQAAREADAAKVLGQQRVSDHRDGRGPHHPRRGPGGARAGVRAGAAVSDGADRPKFRNVLLALPIGLSVAGVAGLLLARVLARPLRRAAAGGAHAERRPAGSAGAGRGPAEVAEVAHAVNGLAEALQRSESRQREFLLSVSHELRTPLTAVSGFAESLADSVVTGEDVPAVGRTIQQEAHRLDRLVSDLLDLARLGADDFRLDIVDVDLTAIMEAAAPVWGTAVAAGNPVPGRAARPAAGGPHGSAPPASGARWLGRERSPGDPGRPPGRAGLAKPLPARCFRSATAGRDSSARTSGSPSNAALCTADTNDCGPSAAALAWRLSTGWSSRMGGTIPPARRPRAALPSASPSPSFEGHSSVS